MSELRDVAEAMVTCDREAGLCPSPTGCEYCDQFGCPRAVHPVASVVFDMETRLLELRASITVQAVADMTPEQKAAREAPRVEVWLHIPGCDPVKLDGLPASALEIEFVPPDEWDGICATCDGNDYPGGHRPGCPEELPA